MSIVDDIQARRYDAYDKNLTPKILCISVSNLIELNKQLDWMGGKADTSAAILSMIDCYVYGTVFGLDVVIGKSLEVLSE